MNNLSRFQGRRAVVTGGASGIGFAACERIAAEGGQVAIWDLDGEHMVRAACQSPAGTV